jgi:hypothetical protein
MVHSTTQSPPPQHAPFLPHPSPHPTAPEVEELLPNVTFNRIAHMLVLKSAAVKQEKLPGTVAIITAGTADPHVVEECRLMLQVGGRAAACMQTSTLRYLGSRYIQGSPNPPKTHAAWHGVLWGWASC